MRNFLLCLGAALLLACGDGGFQRGVFHGKVIDRMPEEVADAFGKPAEVRTTTDNNIQYVYTRKTFDPDNQNRVDEKTIVEFAKNKDGKVVCIDVSYM